jgi:serine/threonine-protein kinase
MRRVLAAGVAAFAFVAGAPARAESSSEVQAQVLFDEAKHLRDAGHVSEACTKFSQSQQLSPGVGITLHLADCYERLGRTASAWQEFRLAEKTAREQNDAKRAELAHNRAETIEATLTRLVVEVPQDAAATGGSVQVDGVPIPADAWNKPLAVDPGDHVIAFAMPGQEPRTKTAYLGASAPLRTVHFDVAAAAAATPAPAPAQAPAPAAPEPAPPPPDNGAGRRWAEYGLGGAGLVGIGIGAALLAADSQSPSTSNSGCSTPPPDSGLMTGAIIAFGAGGAALLSALVLYLTGPHPAAKAESALVVAPAPLPGGGGGAFLRGAF